MSFATSAEAKAKGWFSRRHQTDEAHRAAQAAREERKAKPLTQTRPAREQLEELDRRLGKDVGARKERAKLLARIAKGE